MHLRRDEKLSEERELEQKGERLAEVAVKSELGAKQLRAIYNLVRTKPLPFVEAFIKYQINRVSGREAWEMMLGLLREFGDKKELLSKVLMYANMLYDYHGIEVVKTVAEESARNICQQQNCKYVGLEVSVDRNRYEVLVKVGGFRDDPRSLASPIWREIISKHPSFQGKVWINQVDRR